jgi:hypothetical protein
MKDQEIIDNAPEGAEFTSSMGYLWNDNDDWFIYETSTGEWLHLFFHEHAYSDWCIRSLADIKRIGELERSLKIAECMIENQKLEIANLNAALKESKWINCRAKLPEYGAPVTVKAHGVVQNVTYTLSGAGDDFDEKLDWFEPYHFEHDDNCKIPLSNNVEWMPLPKGA